jgi:cytochrome c
MLSGRVWIGGHVLPSMRVCTRRPAAAMRKEGTMFKEIVVCTALVAMAMANPASAQQSPPTSEQAKKIEALVNNAAALVEKQGKAAFSEFRKRDSEWWSGNTYLFAYDINLNVLLNPAFPKREGTNPRGEKCNQI